MNDNVSKVSMLDRHMDGVSMGSSCRYAADGLPQVHLSSLNRAKIALNKIASNAPIEPPKPAAPLPAKSIPFRERSSVSERSSSSSPVKSATSRESVTQFCLCQPDPKIPRPRNGMLASLPFYTIRPKSWLLELITLFQLSSCIVSIIKRRWLRRIRVLLIPIYQKLSASNGDGFLRRRRMNGKLWQR